MTTAATHTPSAPEASDAGRGEFARGWKLVVAAALGIGLGLSPVPFYTIGMLAPELAKAFGWSMGAIMAGIPVMTLTVMIAGPLMGWLADRVGVRRVALTSVVLFGLSFMGFALSTGSLAQYYLTWALMALAGTGTVPITWTRAVNAQFDRRKGLALGLAMVGTGIFGFLVKPYTAWLIADYGWRAAYVAVGILPIVLAFPVAWLWFHDTAPANPAASSTPNTVGGMSLRQALGDFRFWLLALSFTAISFGVGGPIPNMENILRLAGFERGDIVALVSLIGLAVIAGRVVGGWLLDRFWAPGVAFVMLAAPAWACWQLSAGGLTATEARLAILTIGFAAGIEFDVLAFLTARYFGLRHYGSIYGVLWGFFVLGAGVGPVVFGRLFDASGTYSGVLQLAAVLLFLGAALLPLLGRYRRFD
jgi:MFS family permease